MARGRPNKTRGLVFLLDVPIIAPNLVKIIILFTGLDERGAST
jgi:hypothetical protein